MLRNALTFLLSICILNNFAYAESADAPLDTDMKKLSYLYGMRLGDSLKNNPQKLDIKLVEKGMKDTFLGREALYTPAEATKLRTELFQKWQKQHAEERKEKAKENSQKAADYLKKNSTTGGVKTTKSGLQYKVHRKGEGTHPGATDMVTVHYSGKLTDGSEFDSSYKRDQPATFALNQVIPGWTEGLQLMKPGSKYTFYIPPKLGYGENGYGNKIGPNEVLVFDVELLEIKAKDKTKKQ